MTYHISLPIEYVHTNLSSQHLTRDELCCQSITMNLNMPGACLQSVGASFQGTSYSDQFIPIVCKISDSLLQDRRPLSY